MKPSIVVYEFDECGLTHLLSFPQVQNFLKFDMKLTPIPNYGAKKPEEIYKI
jgi:hypothetical protein